jgi:hypothetical protein
VVDSSRLHGELNILVVTVQVVREVLQPVGSVQSDDENFVHLTALAEGLMGNPVERHLLGILYEEVGDDRRQWSAHGHSVNLFAELVSESEVGGVQDTTGKPRDIILKMWT